MHHEPCGLLSDTQSGGDFVGANAILAAYEQPHGGEPFLQWNWRVLENCPDLQRKLLARMLLVAFPDAGIGKILHFFRVALGAADFAILPAICNHELLAVLKVAEVLNGLLKGFWRFHGYKSSTKVICQSSILLPY